MLIDVGNLFKVMSGKPPFFGLRELQIIRRVFQDHQPRSEDHPEIPSSDPLWSLMRSCWKKTPQERPVIQEVVRKASLNGVLDFHSHTELYNYLIQLRESIHDEAVPLPMSSDPLPSNLIPEQDSWPLPSDPSPSDFISEQDFSVPQNLFRDLELESHNIIPARRYIEAAAEIGSALLEIAQVSSVDFTWSFRL